MTVFKLLEALPNELIDQILCYVGQLERLDRRPSAYGVLSRVNRRLHTLALPHLFFTTILPVKKADRDEDVLAPAPLALYRWVVRAVAISHLSHVSPWLVNPLSLPVASCLVV